MKNHNEPKQERTKEELEKVYQILHKKYNDAGVNLPSLETIREYELRPRRGHTPSNGTIKK